MKKLLVIVIAAVLAAGGGFWYWRVVNSDERKIVRVLEACAETAGFRQGESQAGAFLKLRKLEDLLTTEVDVIIRIQGRTYQVRLPRKEIIQRLAAARKMTSNLDIELSDLNVTVDGDEAVADASVQFKIAGGGADKYRDSAVEEVRFTLTKADGSWRVSAVRAKDFMER